MKKKDQEKEEKEQVEAQEEISLSPEECKELLNKVQELEAMKDKMLRTAADFENSKKRLAREKDEFVKFAKESLIRELITILDNFERALLHADDENPDNLKGVVSGIQMVFKQMTDVLKQQGLKRIETKGKQFDPNLHEAVGYVQEEGEEDQIVDEVAAGYELHDRLLRAPKVRVRIAPKPSENSSEEEK